MSESLFSQVQGRLNALCTPELCFGLNKLGISCLTCYGTTTKQYPGHFHGTDFQTKEDRAFSFITRFKINTDIKLVERLCFLIKFHLNVLLEVRTFFTNGKICYQHASTFSV